ncbi:hypothetical protein GCM10008090_33160 [Arenicella chitinivorans]|uniref:Uncharacterized protein n=1 Tax=Arenicella chitinivorans TaxID=1329800 RepID=A0A918VT40_9GAMM|nr:Ig-like domain-containing protein [Arenicella chitinivorans]GHA20620.1 hypothetical protein GCM10008090_33160 [Arenicella chitinivorans]
MNKAAAILVLLIFSSSSFAASYPPNRDYGSEGDFIIKRGTERGRTANLSIVGPLLVNLPEGPGSTSVGVEWRWKDTVWDISNLLDPQLIREISCETCGGGQPIGAHGTVTRFYEGESYLYTRGGSEEDPGAYMTYNPNGVDSNAQADTKDLYTFGREAFNYTMMFSPYFVRTFWDYGSAPGGDLTIRNADHFVYEGHPDHNPEDYSESEPWWTGVPYVSWDHLSESGGVTGFGSWLGNLLVMASDQRSTGIAIYDTAGFKQGIKPRLLSSFQPRLTEPDGNMVGIGGYWAEPYGTNKMVWAARQRETEPRRNYPAMFVVDFTDPTNPELTCELYFDKDKNDPTDGDESSDPMYVNFQDQYAYVDHFRVDIDRCEQAYADDVISDQEFQDIVFRFDDIQNGCDGSQYFRPLGQVGILGGYDWGVTDSEITYSGGSMTNMQWHVNQNGVGFNPVINKGTGHSIISTTHGESAGNTLAVGDTIRNIVTGALYTLQSRQRNENINEQGMCFFVTSDQPDTTAPYVSGHRPLDGQVNYPIDGLIHFHIPETLRTETAVDAVTVTQLDNAGDVVTEISFRQQKNHTGTISIWPDSELLEDTTYRVDIVGIQDFMGNTMLPYSFSFTTGEEVSDGGPVDPGDDDPAPTYPGTPYYPNQSSQLSCRPESEDNNLWVVNPDNDSVTVIDTTLDATTQRLSSSVTEELYLNYENPTSITRVGELYAITFRRDDKIVFYDAITRNPVFSLDSGHGSQPIASLSSDEFLYVALYGSGEVIKIDVANRAIDARLFVGPTPNAMAMTGNRLLVTRQISATDYAEVYDVNTSRDMTLTRTIRVNKVTVQDDIDHGSGVPNLLSGIVITPDGQEALVSAVKSNTDRGLTRSGEPLDDDNTVRPMLIRLDLVNNRDANVDPFTREGTIDFDNAADPSAVTFLVSGQDRVVSLQGNNLVKVDNATRNTGALFPAGSAPQSMCTTLRTLYVKDFTGRTVSAIDVAEYLHDGNINPRVVTINTVSDELMTAEQLRGKQVFYHSSMPEMGPEGYMSCSSCHVDSGGDGRVWDISALGEGLRNTLSLNGTSGTRFGNLHWSSNFDEVQDFELQIEQLNAGTGLIDGVTFTGQSPLDFATSNRSPDLDALAAYVASLGKKTVSRSPYRTYVGELTPAALRGQIEFNERGCASCHSGNAFRDGRSHDVGTITSDSGSRLGGLLTAIRTPSLIELWQSAPYFHDGSAATLSDVFDRGAHQQSFSGTQEADLITFISSIDRDMYIDDDEVFAPGSDTQPPTAPTGLNADTVTSNSVTFSWNAASDNVGVSRYAVFVNGSEVSSSTTTSASINSLDPSTTYSLTVMAIDEADNRSAVSMALSVTTLEEASNLDQVTYFVFGHSLFNHGEKNAGYWLGLLAQASNTIAGGNGQFGQLSYTSIPPNPDAVFDYPTNNTDENPWPWWATDGFGGRDYTHTLFMPSNFEQEYLTPNQYLSDTYRVLDFVEQEEPSTDIMLYMHWPEPSMLGIMVQNGNQMSDNDFATYNQYTSTGHYYDWHVEYQNLIAAQRPDYNVRTIPVGPIIADIITNEPYMNGVSFEQLYEDDAPHGVPTVYFLAAMICYRAMYQQNPSLSYNPPASDLLPQVVNNYANLVSYIESRLAYYDSLPGALKVY